MSQTARIALGIAAILPSIAVALLFGSGVLPGAEEIEAQGREAFMAAWMEHALPVSLLTMAVTTLFIVVAYRSDRVPAPRRIFWALLLVIAGPVALLAFWWLYCWERGPAIAGWRN